MEDDANSNVKTSIYKPRGSFRLRPERHNAAVATATQTFLFKVLRITGLPRGRAAAVGREEKFQVSTGGVPARGPASTWAPWCNPPSGCSCTGRWTRSSPAAVNQTQTQR